MTCRTGHLLLAGAALALTACGAGAPAAVIAPQPHASYGLSAKPGAGLHVFAAQHGDEVVELQWLPSGPGATGMVTIVPVDPAAATRSRGFAFTVASLNRDGPVTMVGRDGRPVGVLRVAPGGQAVAFTETGHRPVVYPSGPSDQLDLLLTRARSTAHAH